MPSLLTTVLGLALLAQTQAHVSIVNIYGSNNLVGHAFGVDLNGKYPRVVGAPGDAGGDSGIFQTGTDNPSPACGDTPELGPLDVPAWLAQAEGFGLPAAYSNMSIVMEVFQVNRDGGGPMSCEYNEDATANSWRPMFMSLNQAGNSGIQNQQRVNSTVVANFPPDATCTGGFTKTACIIRCRTGVNRRFGGCFAAKLSNSEAFTGIVSDGSDLNATVVSRVTADAPAAACGAMSDQAMDAIVQKVILAMETSGLLVSSTAEGSQNISSSSVNSTSGAVLRSVDSNQTVPISGNSTTNASVVSAPAGAPNGDEASDAADALDAAAAPDASNVSGTPDASDVADASDAAKVTNPPNVADASDVADAANASGAKNDTPAVSNPPDASDIADALNDPKSTNTAASVPNPAGPLTAANTTDASDIADAAYYQSENQTKNAVPVNGASPSTSPTSDAASSLNPKQLSATSKAASHRSKRNCGATKRRHSKPLEN